MESSVHFNSETFWWYCMSSEWDIASSYVNIWCLAQTSLPRHLNKLTSQLLYAQFALGCFLLLLCNVRVYPHPSGLINWTHNSDKKTKQLSIGDFSIVAKDGFFWLSIVTSLQLIYNVTRTLGTAIMTSYSSLVLARSNWHNSPGYLCHIGAEPITNCNSNETYVILFQIYPCITY